MSCATPETENSFADRLRVLIGHESVSAFSRRVGLSEAMIRKYLNGSEPTLSRANQIARQANCSLEWLATGQGFQYRQAEVVDMRHKTDREHQPIYHQPVALLPHQSIVLAPVPFQMEIVPDTAERQ